LFAEPKNRYSQDALLVFVGEKGATKKRRKEGSEIVVKAPHERFLIGYTAEAKEAKRSKVERFFRLLPLKIHGKLHSFVLSYFKTVNHKAGKRMKFLFMKLETFEHVDSVIKVFKWIILPATLFYVLGSFFFLRETVFDSALLGILLFFYSNFLPDLPAIFRRKNHRDIGIKDKSLPWYKNCALLLFAPLFIGLFLCGIRLRWKTIETFHNFKFLAIYVAFLSIIGFFVFTSFPIGIGDVTESLSVPFYGLAGYLTHLRVDLCF
jgi:hypothetical protein